MLPADLSNFKPVLMKFENLDDLFLTEPIQFIERNALESHVCIAGFINNPNGLFIALPSACLSRSTKRDRSCKPSLEERVVHHFSGAISPTSVLLNQTLNLLRGSSIRWDRRHGRTVPLCRHCSGYNAIAQI